MDLFHSLQQLVVDAIVSVVGNDGVPGLNSNLFKVNFCCNGFVACQGNFMFNMDVSRGYTTEDHASLVWLHSTDTILCLHWFARHTSLVLLVTKD